jgi:phosphatidate phosphatase PAH1
VEPPHLTLVYQGSTTGAIDVVAVRDSQGNLSCSPFHVKLNKPAQKGDCCRIVKLTVNSKDVALSMKIGSAGEAFFVERTNLKSLSRNPVHPPANSIGFEQGTTSKKTVFEIPQHSLLVPAEVNGNATRSYNYELFFNL